jgi:hypothetical protein
VRSEFSTFVSAVYLVVGLVVASRNAFFADLSTLRPILYAVLAVVLWPLILLGVDLHFR